jgi:hypothetical protein
MYIGTLYGYGNEEADRFNTIAITPKMLEEFRTAFKLPEGAYRIGDKG